MRHRAATCILLSIFAFKSGMGAVGARKGSVAFDLKANGQTHTTNHARAQTLLLTLRTRHRLQLRIESCARLAFRSEHDDPPTSSMDAYDICLASAIHALFDRFNMKDWREKLRIRCLTHALAATSQLQYCSVGYNPASQPSAGKWKLVIWH